MAKTAARKPRAKKDPDAPKETRAQKFSRLASARINTARKKISLLANLSGPGYEYTPEQVDKLAATLKQTCDDTMARFVKTKVDDTAPVTI